MPALTREQAINGTRRGASEPARTPSQLEIVAQQALALQSQCNALVGLVLGLLAETAPEVPSGPQMPATFGGAPRHEEEG